MSASAAANPHANGRQTDLSFRGRKPSRTAARNRNHHGAEPPVSWILLAGLPNRYPARGSIWALATTFREMAAVGIEYIVGLDCEPKRALSLEKMVALIKARNQAATIIELARKGGDQRPPEQFTFTRMVMRPTGQEREQVSVGALLQQTAELKVHAGHCKGCPANMTEEPYGCYGAITYPISVAAEEWLMSLLPDDPKSVNGHLLRMMVKDFRYDGGMFLNMRGNPVFFESRQPVKRKWGSWFSSWTFTSDQLLQMLFGLGTLESAHCKMMCIVLGMVKLEAEPNTLPAPTTDQAREFARAINAMALASELDVRLIIDA